MGLEPSQQLVRLDLVVLDKLGYLPFTRSVGQLLFHLGRLVFHKLVAIMEFERKLTLGLDLHGSGRTSGLLTLRTKARVRTK